MRGTPISYALCFLLVGIIPAYAGNTDSLAGVGAVRWDHPRVCGEHQNGLNIGQNRLGSSPRMRGTRDDQRHADIVQRIIPAYAGNTMIFVSIRFMSWDHPRVCGEHLAFIRFWAVNLGSSPRMRGTLVRRNVRFLPYGIIPAYAGNTPSRNLTATWSRDHPRVCGEHRAHILPTSLR